MHWFAGDIDRIFLTLKTKAMLAACLLSSAYVAPMATRPAVGRFAEPSMQLSKKVSMPARLSVDLSPL